MALDTKLILEALNERFAALEVMFDNFLNSGSKDSTAPASSSSPSKQGTAQEASKAVIADNWGGLFDGGDDLDTAVSNTASAESVGLHDVPVPIQSAVFRAGVFADNWGGLFDGGDDLDAAVSNTASAGSVGLHDVPVCDPASFDLNTPVSNTISIKLVSSDGTKRSVDRPLTASEALAKQVPEERFAEEVDLYDFPCDGNDQALPHRVNLDAPPFVLALNVAEVGAKVFPSAGSKRGCEFIEGGLAASRPRRVPPRPPRPRRPRRARLRVHQLRRPPSPATSTSSAAAAKTVREAIFTTSGSEDTTAPATSSSAPSPPTPAPTRPPVAPATWMTAQPGISACFPDPVTRAAEKVANTNSPTRRSTACCSGDVRELVTISTATPVVVSAFQDIPKHLKPVLVTSMAISAKLPPTSMNALVVFEEMQQRYITNLAPAVIGSSSACFVYPPLLDTAIEMSEGMISQGTVMLLDQLPAHEFDKQQWPPPLVDCNTLLIGTSQGGLSFCSPVGFCPATAQRKPPWPPPPVQSEVTDDKVQLRPIPWPSFWGYSVDMHWLKFLKYAQPAVKFIWVQYLSDKGAFMISNWKSVVGLIQSYQHVLLVGSGCYQLQGTRIRTYLFIWSPWNCQCSASVSLQCVMHIANAQLRPIPWPSFGSHTVMQLENFLLLTLVSIGIPVYPEFLNGWHISGCSANSSGQVLTFSWSPSLCLYFNSSFIFWGEVCWLIFTWKLSWVCQKCFAMSSCCFVSKIHIGHFGLINLTWWPKTKLSTLPAAYSLCEVVNFSSQWLKMTLLHKFILSLVNSSWIQVQTQNVSTTKSLQNSSSLCWLSSSVSASLCEPTLRLGIVWATDGSNRNIHIFEHIVLMMQEHNLCLHGHSAYVGGTSSLPRCSGFESIIYSFTQILDLSAVLNMDECCKIYRFSYKNYMVTFEVLIILWSSTRNGLHLFSTKSSVPVLSSMVGVMVFIRAVIWYATVSTLHLTLWDPGGGPCHLDACTSLGMGFKLKNKQELIMIINYWRFSLCIIQFYHQVVDDP